MLYNIDNSFEQLNDNDIKNYYKSKSQHLRYEIKNNVYNYIADNIDIKEEYRIFDFNFLKQKIERGEIELHGKSNNDIHGVLNGENIINDFNSAISSALCRWTEKYIKRVSK